MACCTQVLKVDKPGLVKIAKTVLGGLARIALQLMWHR